MDDHHTEPTLDYATSDPDAALDPLDPPPVPIRPKRAAPKNHWYRPHAEHQALAAALARQAERPSPAQVTARTLTPEPAAPRRPSVDVPEPIPEGQWNPGIAVAVAVVGLIASFVLALEMLRGF